MKSAGPAYVRTYHSGGHLGALFGLTWGRFVFSRGIRGPDASSGRLLIITSRAELPELGQTDNKPVNRLTDKKHNHIRT